jgi:hypothetical protein
MPTTTKLARRGEITRRGETISPELKSYLRSIGHKGGVKSSQHPNRRQLNKEAAEARWRKDQPKPKEIPK